VAYWDGICKCVSALPAGNFPEAHCSVHLIENSCALGYKLPCLLALWIPWRSSSIPARDIGPS